MEGEDRTYHEKWAMRSGMELAKRNMDWWEKTLEEGEGD